MSNIGVLHPGEMGVSVAVSALNSGHHVYWASDGRSDETRSRAEKYGLIEVKTPAELCSTCEIILSICPPHAAEDVARSVIAEGFQGLYLDANAIAPQTSIHIGKLMGEAGIRFVDGGIIGGPAWTPHETWLYLSGNDAKEIAACFSQGPLETKLLGDEIGKASALKMCYAAYSKGTTALLVAILGAAEALDVREALCQQWNVDYAGFADEANQRVGRVRSKAWRFEGEMREIAATLREAGVPGEFHDAAAETFRRIADLRYSDVPVTVEEVLSAVRVSKK